MVLKLSTRRRDCNRRTGSPSVPSPERQHDTGVSLLILIEPWLLCVISKNTCSLITLSSFYSLIPLDFVYAISSWKSCLRTQIWCHYDSYYSNNFPVPEICVCVWGDGCGGCFHFCLLEMILICLFILRIEWRFRKGNPCLLGSSYLGFLSARMLKILFSFTKL